MTSISRGHPFLLQTKAHPNVIVRMALGQNHAAPASDATNVNFTSVVRGWGALSSRLYLWDYVANYCNMIMPHPVWLNLGANSIFYHTLGVRGLFAEVRSIINVFFRGAISKNMQMLHTEYLPRQAWDAAGRTPRFHPGCSLAGGVLECGRGCQGSDRPLH